MGNNRVEWSLVKQKGKAAPPDDDVQEEDPSVLQEKLYCARLELQKTLSLSADADETISRLAAAARRMAKERDEACMKRNALLAELQARRNAQVMMAAALASGSPSAAAFSCYGNRAPVPFGRMTVQEQCYARAAGASYCFASSSSRSRTPGQDSFDPDMFLVDAAEGDSGVPATAKTAGGGAPGMAGKKKSSGSELSLVAEQMLRLPRKKGEVVQAPVHEQEDDDDADTGTSVEETVSDAGSTEAGDSVDEKEECCGGGGCSLADVVSSASKKRK